MPILDLNDVGDLRALAATVCVVGSGPGGGVVASELSAAGIDVLLLEAGPVSFDAGHSDIISNINVDEHVDLSLGYSCQLGGSSNRWGGRTAPFEAVDLADRPWVYEGGWPIAWPELEPYLRQAADLIGIPDFDQFSATSNGRIPVLSEGIETRCYQWARRPVNLRDVLLQAASRSGSTLRIVVNAPATKLEVNGDRTRVDSVTVVGPSGKPITIKARLFVLAAGAIETPRLLLNSHGQHACGLGDDYGHVGRYFSTHPRAYIGSLRLNKPVWTQHPLMRTEALGSGYRRYCLGLSASEQAAIGGLNHHIQLFPFLEYKLNRLFEDVKRSKLTSTKLFDRGSRTRTFLPRLGRMGFQTLERATSVKIPAWRFVLRGFLDQFPDPDNRISLSDERDPRGMRQVSIDWRFTDRDRQSVLVFLEKLDANVRSSGAGAVDYSVLKDGSEWSMTGIHSHFMGTTRMGHNEQTAVTDRDGRLFQTGNLYISGPSTFTTSGSANPFFTIVALSLRLAEHLRVRLNAPYHGLVDMLGNASVPPEEADFDPGRDPHTRATGLAGQQSDTVPTVDR